MHDTFIFNLTLCAIGVLLILAMWVGLWKWFDYIDQLEFDEEMKSCEAVEQK